MIKYIILISILIISISCNIQLPQFYIHKPTCENPENIRNLAEAFETLEEVLTIGASDITIKQKVRQYRFKLTIDDPTQYTILELWMNAEKSQRLLYHDVPLIILAMQDIEPQIIYDEEQNSISFGPKETPFIFDSNGFYAQKDYRYLKFPKSDDPSPQTWNILIHVQEGAVYEYNIVARSSEKEECPNQCREGQIQKGTCISGICKCFPNRIDEDCSIDAPQLEKDVTKTLTVHVKNIQYIYFEMPQSSSYYQEDLVLNIRKFKDEPIILYSQLGAVPMPVYYPTSMISEDINVIKDNEVKFFLPNEYLIGPEGQSKKVIFGIQSLTSEVHLVEFMVSENNNSQEEDPLDSNMMIVYFLLAIAGVLFIVWIVLTIIRIKYRNDNNTQQLHPFGLVQRRRRQNPNTLTPELIEKYMPATEFKVLKEEASKKMEDEESCSVCLVEFEDADLVRTTICTHYFHPECLENWLQKHENCPLCREELTKKKLDDAYYAAHPSQAREQDEQQQQQSPRRHHQRRDPTHLNPSAQGSQPQQSQPQQQQADVINDDNDENDNNAQQTNQQQQQQSQQSARSLQQQQGNYDSPPQVRVQEVSRVNINPSGGSQLIVEGSSQNLVSENDPGQSQQGNRRQQRQQSRSQRSRAQLSQSNVQASQQQSQQQVEIVNLDE